MLPIYLLLQEATNIGRELKVTEEVCRSNFSKIVIFGMHNLCGVGFLMQKKKI